MNYWRNFAKKIADDNTSIMADAEGSAEFTGCIDTGCYALNALLSGSLKDGGIPNNSATAFAGDPATGKTFFVLGIMANFLAKDPKAGVAFFETESAVRTAMANARGIDTERVIRFEPENLDDFKFRVMAILEEYTTQDDRCALMLALDSLGMLPSSKEVEDAIKHKDVKDMSKASTIKGIFRMIRLRLAKLRIPMLITNHVYSSMDQYSPKQISGGSGLIYAADTIVTLSKAKLTQGEGKDKENIGVIITAKTFKSRLSKENQEVKVKLRYDSGLDRWYGLREIAEDAGIFKKVSTQVQLPDGKKVFGKQIDDNPTEFFTPEIMAQLEKAVNKMFLYGNDPRAIKD